MLYPTIRPLATMALLTYFRKIYLSNQERVPKKAGVILACTHPTAFVEPCILACFMDRPLNFLVRGDFFKNPIHGAMLRNLHMLPIYRKKDGDFKHRRTNLSTFDVCYEVLHDHKTLLIMAEGGATHEKRMKSVQKGVARVALGTLERYPEEEIYIIPTGVNYTQDDVFRSEAMIDFGEPIQARLYLDLYQENPREAILQVTKELENRLKDRTIIIADPSDDELAEKLLEIKRSEFNQPIFPIVEERVDRLMMEKSITSSINEMPKGDKKPLAKKVDDYMGQVASHGLYDRTLVHPSNFTYTNTLLLILGFLPFLVGYLWNYPPVRFGKYVADKKAIHITYYSSLAISVAIGAYLIYFSVWLFLLWLIVGWPWFLSLFIMPILGFHAVLYLELWDRWGQGVKLYRMSPEVLNNLRAVRQEVVGAFEGMKR